MEGEEVTPEMAEAARVRLLTRIAEKWHLDEAETAAMMGFGPRRAGDLFEIYDAIAGLLQDEDAERDWIRRSVGKRINLTTKAEAPLPPLLTQILGSPGDFAIAYSRMMHFTGRDGSWGGVDMLES